jgi:hypothetical protein
VAVFQEFTGFLDVCLVGRIVSREAEIFPVRAIGMARAVSDKKLSREILKTAAQRLKNLAA